MIALIVFAVTQIGTSAIAWWHGGQPERWVAVLLPLAYLATLAVGQAPRTYQYLHPAVLNVDLVLLVVLVLVALRANRFWPIWVAALQLLGVASHAVRVTSPGLLPSLYYGLMTYLAYAICATVGWGTWHVVRRRRLQGVAPRDWSPLRW